MSKTRGRKKIDVRREYFRREMHNEKTGREVGIYKAVVHNAVVSIY